MLSQDYKNIMTLRLLRGGGRLGCDLFDAWISFYPLSWNSNCNVSQLVMERRVSVCGFVDISKKATLQLKTVRRQLSLTCGAIMK